MYSILIFNVENADFPSSEILWTTIMRFFVFGQQMSSFCPFRGEGGCPKGGVSAAGASRHCQNWLFTIFDNSDNYWQFLQQKDNNNDNPRSFGVWDTDCNSDNWAAEFMTIFVTWHLRVTQRESIQNSYIACSSPFENSVLVRNIVSS